MRLRVADPAATFDRVVDVPVGTTVGDLKQYVNSHLHYGTSNCLVFSAGHAPWDDSQPLALPDDTLLVFFNQEQFREKSYPSIDDAFAFPLSRFGRPMTRPADNLDVAFELVRADDSDSEASDDEMRPRHGRQIIHEMIGDDGGDVPGIRIRLHDLREEMAIIHPIEALLPMWITPRELRRQMGVGDDEELEIQAIPRRMPDDERFMRLGDVDSDSEEEEAAERAPVALDGVPLDLTAEQDAAVRHIHAMVPGFGFNLVVQVYFACDKDEEATHRCLLSMA
jgi:hypothetical protein